MPEKNYPQSAIFSTERILLYLILATAAILRFYHYSTFSYANDELSALMRLRYDSFGELVAKGFYVDGHPGGVQVFLWYWLQLFGNSEAAVRFPFVIAGILSVYMVFKIGKFAFGNVSGLVAAAVMTFLQFPLLYSQIARPYGSGVLFSLFFIWFWMQLVFQKEQSRKSLIIYLIGFAISASLCMYNHYFSFLFALITGLTGLFLIPRKRLPLYLMAAIFSAILFLPHLYITLNHLTYKGVGFWLGKPSPAFLFQHIYFIFDSSLYTISIILLTSLLLFLFRKGVSKLFATKLRIVFLMLFLLPVLVGYIYSILVSPVLQDSVLIFSFPCLVLALFSFGGSELTKKNTILLITFLGAGIAGTVFINKFYSKQHFGEFKDIAALSVAYDKQLHKDMEIVISTNNPDYLKYYFEKAGQEADVNYLNINDTAGLRSLKDIAATSQKKSFLFAWTKTCPTGYEDIIKSYYPEQRYTKKYGKHSMLKVFSKEEDHKYSDNFSIIKSIELYNPDATTEIPLQLMDSVKEYSNALAIDIDTLKTGEHYRIEASGIFKSENSNLNALFVLSVEQDGKSLIWTGNPLWWFMNGREKCIAINHVDFIKSANKNMKIKCYFWNQKKQKFMYQNIELTIKRNTLNQKDDDFVHSFPH